MRDQENALEEWLKQVLGTHEFSFHLLNGDASFRRYFRIKQQEISYILMDSSFEKASLNAFIKIDRLLSSRELLVPQMYAADENLGFALLDDLGDTLLLQKLNLQTFEHYYHKAIDTLLKLQEIKTNLPEFDQNFMLSELDLFKHWFLHAYLKLNLSQGEKELIDKSFLWLVNECAKQPKVMIHRDYHSRNLMIVEKELGVIDFQDAMLGPLTYDLASLLKDCYILCPQAPLIDCLKYFYQRSKEAQKDSFADFYRSFDLIGLQRHLKVLGIFSRLYLRDNKKAYLPHLPLTLHYVQSCLETYEELQPLYEFFQTRITLP